MTVEECIALAKDCGFSVAEPLDVKTLKFMPEVRDMCAAGRCGVYGHNWCCPPACGSLEELSQRASGYSRGVLLQMIGEREDSFDIEAAEENDKRCKAALYKLTDALVEAGEDIFPLSAGTCTRCSKCTYPDAPCRFPDRAYPSMEAAGLFVTGVCKDNGVPYYYGETKIAFTCCVLMR